MKREPPEQFRITAERAVRLRLPSQLASDETFGRNGLFYIPRGKEILRCVVSDELGWEHVSVSLTHRCPTWDEMCFVKDVFWDGDECVVQYHPPKAEYVNHHPYCLHLWKHVQGEFATPPAMMVGPRG